jgi:hypothetical protein
LERQRSCPECRNQCFLEGRSDKYSNGRRFRGSTSKDHLPVFSLTRLAIKKRGLRTITSAHCCCLPIKGAASPGVRAARPRRTEDTIEVVASMFEKRAFSPAFEYRVDPVYIERQAAQACVFPVRFAYKDELPMMYFRRI